MTHNDSSLPEAHLYLSIFFSSSSSPHSYRILSPTHFILFLSICPFFLSFFCRSNLNCVSSTASSPSNTFYGSTSLGHIRRPLRFLFLGNSTYPRGFLRHITRPGQPLCLYRRRLPPSSSARYLSTPSPFYDALFLYRQCTMPLFLLVLLFSPIRHIHYTLTWLSVRMAVVVNSTFIFSRPYAPTFSSSLSSLSHFPVRAGHRRGKRVAAEEKESSFYFLPSKLSRYCWSTYTHSFLEFLFP